MPPPDSPTRNPPVLEGRLQVQLDHLPTGGIHATLQSSRPVLACRLFEQRPVNDTLRLLPMLFSLCGRAQGVAAVRAVESALAMPASSAVEAQRDALVSLESIREHLWRILLDWPATIGLPPQTAMLAPLNQGLGALMTALSPSHALSRKPGLQSPPADAAGLQRQWRRWRAEIEQRVFGGDTDHWLHGNPPQEPDTALPGDIGSWLAARGWLAIGDVALPALPPLPVDALTRYFDGEAVDTWVAEPDWQGEVYETGVLACHSGHPRVVDAQRQWGNGIGTRLLVRQVALGESLAEADQQLGRVAYTRATPAPYCGIAQLETSRGRLIHRVLIADGRIQRYRILAPTEWNFHPQGVAVQALDRLAAADDATLERLARLLLGAIDPCVAFDLSIDPARSAGSSTA